VTAGRHTRPDENARGKRGQANLTPRGGASAIVPDTQMLLSELKRGMVFFVIADFGLTALRPGIFVEDEYAYLRHGGRRIVLIKLSIRYGGRERWRIIRAAPIRQGGLAVLERLGETATALLIVAAGRERCNPVASQKIR